MLCLLQMLCGLPYRHVEAAAGLQGAAAQNRSVEGDEVALRLLPLAQWFEVRNAAGGASPA